MKNDTAEREQKRVAVVYFSGTGCTAEAAKCITKSFSDRGAQTVLLRIPFDAPVPQVEIRHADLLMVLSPVYAFRLTDIMEKWLKKLPQTTRTKAAVISVSGGGEISPNTACRITAKRILRAKGFRVTYEAMLVMPSNFAAATPSGIAARLLAVLPRKADAVVSDIFAGQKRLTRPQLPDRVLAAAGRLEHTGARFFGRFIHAGTSCT